MTDRSSKFLVRIMIATALVLAGFFQAGAQDRTRLLYFSSFPEIMQSGTEPGLAELASAIRSEKERNPNTFFIHGGASLGPSVFGAMDNGAHMVDILNAINPDMMAVGKREFSYGFDNFILNALSATFPLVTSNLVDAATGYGIEATYPSLLLDSEGLAIGVIVLTSSNSVIEYGAAQASVVETEEAVRKAALSLREDDANAIILLADTDYDDLSRFQAGGVVDAIFYTHNFGNPQTLDAQGELINEGPLDGKVIALDIWMSNSVSGDPELLTEASLLNLSDFPAAPDIASIVSDYRQRLDLLLGPGIAISTGAFDTLRDNIRSRENAFANLVTDALRMQVEAEVMLLNGGSIRGNTTYPASHEISRGDIQKELPFGNKTALLNLKGSDLLAALEHGVDCGLRGDGCFIHFSNLSVEYDPRLPMGERVSSVMIAGEPLDPDRLYRTAVSDFMAMGNDGYTMLANSERLYSAGTNRLLWNVVAEYVERIETFEPAIDGRLVNIASSNTSRLTPAGSRVSVEN